MQAGEDAWVNGPYMSDTHQLWAEIEAMAPPPRPKKVSTTPRERLLRKEKALAERKREDGAPKDGSPSEASSSTASKLATGQAPKASGKQPLTAPPDTVANPAPSARKGPASPTKGAQPESPTKRVPKSSGAKAKTYRPRSASPAKRRPGGGLPHDGMGRLVQPAWNTTGPPRRAPGEVVNRWNHADMMTDAGAEAAAGWKAAYDPSFAGALAD